MTMTWGSPSGLGTTPYFTTIGSPRKTMTMSILIPLGFQFAGVHAAIKKNPNKEDLTLVHCPDGAVTAGGYTTNLVYAAPVAVDRHRPQAADMRLVVVKSGNANPSTGEKGLTDAREMARLAAEAV